MTHSNKTSKSAETIIMLLASLLLMSCGGNGSNDGITANAASPPTTGFWDTPTPDFSNNPNRPSITLVGAQTILLSIGDNYVDAGANANDVQDGDLSGDIETIGAVNTAIAGDYLLRYTVSDNEQLKAIEAVRVVRVIDTQAIAISKRPVGSSGSHLGYLVHPEIFILSLNSNFKFWFAKRTGLAIS